VRRARSKTTAVTEDRHALASLFAPRQGAFRCAVPTEAH